MTDTQLNYTLSTSPQVLTTGSSGAFIVQATCPDQATASITRIDIYLPLSTDGTGDTIVGFSNSVPELTAPVGWSGTFNSTTASFVPDAGSVDVSQTPLVFEIAQIDLNPNPASCNLGVTEISEVDWEPVSAKMTLSVSISDGTYVPPLITTTAGQIEPGTTGFINWSGDANYGYNLLPPEMYQPPASGTLDNNENIQTVPLISSYEYTLEVTAQLPTGPSTKDYKATVEVASPAVTAFTVNGGQSAVVDIDDFVTLEWETEHADRVNIHMGDTVYTVDNPTGSYTVQIDRPQSFQITAQFGDPDAYPGQANNVSALYPANTLSVVPTDPKINYFEVVNEKLFANSTVFLKWSASNANMIRLQNSVGTIEDYTPVVNTYNAGETGKAPLVSGDDSPLHYTLWAWYQPSATRTLDWTQTGASYPDDAKTAQLATSDAETTATFNGVPNAQASIPEPNTSASLTLDYTGSAIKFQTVTYTTSNDDKTVTLNGQSYGHLYFGITGCWYQLDSNSSHDLHDLIAVKPGYTQTTANDQTSVSFNLEYYMKDNNGHTSDASSYVDYVIFYLTENAEYGIMGKGMYPADDCYYDMDSTSSAKSFEASTTLDRSGTPAKTVGEIIPFVGSLGVHYHGGDKPLRQIIIDAKQSAAPVSDTSSDVSVSGYSTAFGDHTFGTWLPTTGLIGKYANAAGGYDFILMDDGTSSHTFDYEVDEAVAVLNYFNGSTSNGDDHNIYKFRSDTVDAIVDTNNPCKVNLTWNSAYWGDKSNSWNATRKVLLVVTFKVPQA